MRFPYASSRDFIGARLPNKIWSKDQKNKKQTEGEKHEEDYCNNNGNRVGCVGSNR